MANPGLSHEQKQDAVDAFHITGEKKAAADLIGVNYSTFRNRLDAALFEGYQPRERFTKSDGVRLRKIARPRKGTRTVIVTAAQDSTQIHRPFWENLKAYADHLDAEIIVGPFTYNKSLFEDHSTESASYPPEIAPHIVNHQVEIAGKIVICGEMNTLPTAVNPLGGLQSYTKSLDGVFPHCKIALQSIPQPKSLGAKVNVTTGAVTLRNYVPKKAGMKAQFHHVIGALLIECDSKGRVWFRHLLADYEGDFQDLDTCVCNGQVVRGNGVEAVAWPDIHHEKMDPVVADALFFGPGNMLDTLRPKYQFFNDLSDFRARNHHNMNDLHFLFERWVKNEDCVKADLAAAAQFLVDTKRDGCTSVVVESNHDRALLKWLKKADAYALDPANAIFFLRSQLAIFEAIERGDDRFSIFEHVMRELGGGLDDVVFLREDDSFVVGDVDYGHHGHLGPNGARGSLASFARVGAKMTKAHGHSSGIQDGAYEVGVTQLDMGYNRGLSSWTVTAGVQYGNGKRALVRVIDGRYRA